MSEKEMHAQHKIKSEEDFRAWLEQLIAYGDKHYESARAQNYNFPFSQTKPISVLGGLEKMSKKKGMTLKVGKKLNFDEKIKKKADSLREYLAKDYPKLLTKEASPKRGSPEWGYWHSGYYVALLDILRLMESELSNAIIPIWYEIAHRYITLEAKNTALQSRIEELEKALGRLEKLAKLEPALHAKFPMMPPESVILKVGALEITYGDIRPIEDGYKLVIAKQPSIEKEK